MYKNVIIYHRNMCLTLYTKGEVVFFLIIFFIIFNISEIRGGIERICCVVVVVWLLFLWGFIRATTAKSYLFNDFQYFTDGNCLICGMRNLNDVRDCSLNCSAMQIYSLSSRSVNRPICGKSLNCSRQINPEHSILIIATWSCFTKRGRVLDFSPVFLSTRQIRAWKMIED